MNTRLLVLGFLTHGPTHGYELQKNMEEGYVETWADVLPGSIYHALKQLTKEGLLEVQRTEHTGHRGRAIYALTETGWQELRRLMRETLHLPPHSFPSTFYTAISFLGELPEKEQRAALEQLIPRLESDLKTWREGENIKTIQLPEQHPLRILFQNGREHLEADLRMVRALLEILTLEKA